MSEKELRQKIKALVEEYYRHYHANKKSFNPGDKISYAGRVFDEKEITNLVDASLDFWLTAGRYADQFEKDFAKFLGIKYCSLVNSGSSANLLAFMALTSSKLGDRRVKPGDEVITVAAGFPTTIAPIIQYGAVPVFVDVSLPLYNIDCSQLEKALSKKTKAVMLAHTLGNPFDLAAVKSFCDKHKLFLIEDNCDSLGSKYKLDDKWHYTGTIGDIGTSSFYPPHHMSCSKNTPIPYLDENGRWKLDNIEQIFQLYADKLETIKILSFNNENKVNWIAPFSILRHKLGSKKMLKIVCQHGRTVEVTEDHSVFVLDNNSAKILPKRADLITEDDFVVATNDIPTPGEIHHIDILEHFKNKNAYISGFSHANLKYVKNADYRWQLKDRNSLPIKYLKEYNLENDDVKVGIFQSSKKIPARLLINEQLCRLLGYFIAEGSYQNGLVFSFNRQEKDLIRDVKNIVRSLFDLPVTVREKDHSAVVKIQSKNLEIVFLEIFGIKKGAKNKRLPWFLYHSDAACIKAFVYGYTKGDGSMRNKSDNTNNIDVTSVSKDLLNDFQYLLSRIGISASFYRRNIEKNKIIAGRLTKGNENYTLSFSGYVYGKHTIIKKNIKERNNFALQIPLLSIFRKYISVNKKQKVISCKRLAQYVASNKDLYSLITGDVSFLRVRSVQKIDYEANEYVYDFSVPGQENFYGGFLGVFLHNTMGEGGAVYTNDPLLNKIVNSLRDWGRDCWCPSGKDDTCKKRFKRQLGALPYGYDHKYTYSHFGYNLLATEMQAAIGCAQLEKLSGFIEARKNNWQTLRSGLSDLSDHFILPEPTANSDPSWFGFLLTVKSGVKFNRDKIVQHLEAKGIQTRMLFAGNMVKHPCFDEMRKTGEGYRVVGHLINTDLIMNQTFWVGVYPGMSFGTLQYMIKIIKEFCT
ncbi:DegT/DnrJ/EryC1/StrS family aminotransferase [Candidatus Saganbacteria bacterium]|nr:DegT/DnrJ/EryC1/StrS family aminotransferase [Candidatus Saganbacteria bacterium]